MMNTTATTTKTATYFTFDHIKKQIVGSEFNFKMAGNADKPQYEALMIAMERHPNYTLTPVASKKKASKKQTYEGLTRDLMKDYIEMKKNEVLLAEFKQMIEDKTPYPTMKSWFLETYKGFNVKKAKSELAKHELAAKKEKVRTTVRKKIVKTDASKAPMGLVSNF